MKDKDNGHEETDSVALMVERALEEARDKSADGRRTGNSSFLAVDDKQVGVLPGIMQAIKKTSEYRQELKTANWTDRNEAMKAVAAIHERLMCGVDISPIVDRIIAESAGVESARLHLVIQGLTHTVFTANQSGYNKQHWWQGKPKGDKEPVSSGHDMLG